jgi:hypothetical protein
MFSSRTSPSPSPQRIILRTGTPGHPVNTQTIIFVPHPFGLLCNMPSKTPMASVEQSSPSKVPILTLGDISLSVMHQFEHGCRNYFIHKKIVVDDQVSLIIGGILDDHVSDWISAECDHIVTLSFDVFMTEFHQNYLAEDWEEDTLCELLSMPQGNNTF